MYPLYVFFGVLLFLPVWFICYSLLRFRLHYRDGRQHSHGRLPRLHYFRRTCALTLACASIFNAIDGVPSPVPPGELALRCLFFCTYALAWLLSFALLRFEYSRGLAISWIGHRLFWPASFLALMACAAFQSAQNWTHPQDEELAWPRVAVYLLSASLALLLSLCGLLKPNDFVPGNWREPFISDLQQEETTAASQTQSADLVIEMENYKKKLQGEKSVVLYELRVSIRSCSQVLWKTYMDFEKLQRELSTKLRTEFPMLKLPRLPDFSMSDSIDFKLEGLKRYMTEINFPAFYCDVFLDFLSLPTDIRDFLIREHFKITGNSDLQQARTTSYATPIMLSDLTLSSPRSHPPKLSHSFFEVTIGSWYQTESQDGHIEYEMEWKGCVEGDWECRVGKVTRRFNDFYLMHKGLKQDIAPAKLPDFPSRAFLKKLIKGIDKEAIEARKRALETYMRHTLNDPAFLAPRILEFIDCPLTPIEIFSKHRPNICVIKFHLPIDWEGELGDNDEQYILYLLRLEKAGHQWTVKRRFREFDALHHLLTGRLNSPYLAEFHRVMGQNCGSDLIHPEDFPTMSKKPLPLSTTAEIETRRKGLEVYFQALLQFPYVMEAYAFRQFIEEP